jgi:hypothetical protein
LDDFGSVISMALPTMALNHMSSTIAAVSRADVSHPDMSLVLVSGVDGYEVN